MSQHTTKTEPEYILLLDDDRPTLETLTMVLQFEGHKVRSAATTETAMGIVEQYGPPKLALLDYILDNGTVEGFARSLRARCPKLPIMVMTAGHITDELMHASWHCDILKKPFDMETLVQAVNKFVSSDHRVQ